MMILVTLELLIFLDFFVILSTRIQRNKYICVVFYFFAYTIKERLIMATMENDIVDRKTISVSKKRQITIPLQFYKHLNLDNEVDCSLEDGAIVIRPLNRETTEFSVEILKDLIEQGYSDDELIEQFKLQNDNIKKAVTNILEESDAIASGEKTAENLEDVFGLDV